VVRLAVKAVQARVARPVVPRVVQQVVLVQRAPQALPLLAPLPLFRRSSR
jgi:hypothetical protein